jgi:hypothetical protein
VAAGVAATGYLGELYRQLVNLLGYALVVNSLSLLRHRRREPGGVPIAA